MRRVSFLLVFAVSLIAGGPAAEKPSILTGTVIDNQCGPACATYCPLVKGIRYTLQSGDDAFILSDQKTAARYSGKKVMVRGIVTASNRLKMLSIAPAK